MEATYFDLNMMRNVDINSVDPNTIPDNRDVEVNVNESILERILNYINKVGNPYFNRCGNVLVKIEYSETETTIEDSMGIYFQSIMQLIQN